KGIIDAPQGSHGLVIVAAGLIGAITWNMVTWYFGLPSSSSHALIGGLIGSALASSSVVHWSGVVDKVVIPMILSPLVGFTLAAAIMIAIYWIFRHAQPGPANRGFRYAQTVSAAAMALGHGLQDAQKTMGVIFLSLLVGGYVAPTDPIPQWVIFAAAAAISLGTYAGGWAGHAHAGPPHHRARPAAGLRRRERGGDSPVRCGDRVRRAHLDHTHDHLGDHGRGLDQAAFGRAVGRGGQHRDRLDPYDSGRGSGGCSVVLLPALGGGVAAYMTSTSQRANP